MKLTKETIDILGLSSYEVVVLKVLKDKDYSVQDLSIETSIPRTSLYYALPYLVRRGFIESYRKNKKTLWRSTFESRMAEFTESKLSMNKDNDSEKNNFTNKISKYSELHFYNGKNQAINVLRNISELPAHSRFYGIQPEASIVGAIEKNNLNDIIEFNKKVKESKLIVEGIIHEKGTDSMTQPLSAIEKKKLLDSFSGRSADTSKLPEGFLNNTKAEIYLYGNNKVSIVNWYEEFAVTIENKDVYDLMIEMFKSTKYMLKKYDQNEKIAKRLVDLGI